jgi:hypothetical protein
MGSTLVFEQKGIYLAVNGIMRVERRGFGDTSLIAVRFCAIVADDSFLS